MFWGELRIFFGLKTLLRSHFHLQFTLWPIKHFQIHFKDYISNYCFSLSALNACKLALQMRFKGPSIGNSIRFGHMKRRCFANLDRLTENHFRQFPSVIHFSKITGSRAFLRQPVVLSTHIMQRYLRIKDIVITCEIASIAALRPLFQGLTTRQSSVKWQRGTDILQCLRFWRNIKRASHKFQDANTCWLGKECKVAFLGKNAKIWNIHSHWTCVRSSLSFNFRWLPRRFQIRNEDELSHYIILIHSPGYVRAPCSTHYLNTHLQCK